MKMVAALFGEPYVSVGAGGDAGWRRICRYAVSEFGDDASWRNASDAVVVRFRKTTGSRRERLQLREFRKLAVMPR